MNFYLHPDIKQYFSASTPLFDQLMALNGEVFRSQKGRVTQRVAIGDKHYFIKQHHGVGWKEIIKNIIFGRAPVLGARNEWQAIQKLDALGVSAPKLIGYGERGMNPARRESFVLMEEVAPAISLEDVCRDWQQTPPPVTFKRALIDKVATISRTMHQNGMNHRDFYICHFLMVQPLEQPLGQPSLRGRFSCRSNPEALTLCLIDLHRAQIRNQTPIRLIIKDLAGLYFSSKNTGLTQRDYFRFMKVYRNKSLREIIKTEQNFWQKVGYRGNKLYHAHSIEGLL